MKNSLSITTERGLANHLTYQIYMLITNKMPDKSLQENFWLSSNYLKQFSLIYDYFFLILIFYNFIFFKWVFFSYSEHFFFFNIAEQHGNYLKSIKFSTLEGRKS